MENVGVGPWTKIKEKIQQKDDIGLKRFLNMVTRYEFVDQESEEILKKFPDTVKEFKPEDRKKLLSVMTKIILHIHDDNVSKYIDRLQKAFGILEEEKKAIVYEALIYALEHNIHTASTIAKSFKVSEEILRSPEVWEHFRKGIAKHFAEGAWGLGTGVDYLVPFIPQGELKLLLQEEFINRVKEGRIVDTYDMDEDGDWRYSKDSADTLLDVEPSLIEFTYTEEGRKKINEGFLDMIDEETQDEILTAQKKFNISEDVVRQAFDIALLKRLDFRVVRGLNNLIEEPANKMLEKTISVFGDIANWENYDLLSSLEKGEVSPEMKKLGVKQGGEVGILQLEQGLTKFREEMLKPDFNPEVLKESVIMRDYFKSQIRYDVAAFGRAEQFTESLDRWIEVNKTEGEKIAPLNPLYTPSEVIYVPTVDRTSKSIEYTEAFRSRFQTILTDIQEARLIYRGGGFLKKIIATISGRIEIVKKNLQDQIQDPNPLNNKGEPLSQQQAEFRKNVLQNKHDLLNKMNVKDLRDFQENFKILCDFKELEIDLRRAMFVMGFAKGAQPSGRRLTNVDAKNPALDDLTWIIDFVDHIVNKEVMSKYFTDKQARNKFRDLINVKAFIEELSRFNNQEKIGTLPMKFIPTRGVLLEYSGHIADACWAGGYKDTIAATFPNFTGITMVQNPDTKNEKLCGACLLIETEDQETKEPMLVIRGLNPIENTINQLSIPDFVDQIQTYVESLAKKTGRKPGVVIDGHCGGSSTNRPLLFNYLSNIKDKDFVQVHVPNNDTNFNGYNISNHVWTKK